MIKRIITKAVIVSIFLINVNDIFAKKEKFKTFNYNLNSENKKIFYLYNNGELVITLIKKKITGFDRIIKIVYEEKDGGTLFL